MVFNDVVEEIEVRGRDLLGKVSQLVREGNVSRIIIKDRNGDTFAEIPVTLGVIGVAFMPFFTAIAGLAALVANFKMVVVRLQPKTSDPASARPVDVQTAK